MNQVEQEGTTFCSSWITKFKLPNLIDGTRIAFCRQKRLLGKRSSIQINSDYEIDHQNADVSWSPTWSWGNLNPDSWPIAEREWKGVDTLAMLRSLRDFRRIKSYSLFKEDLNFKYHLDKIIVRGERPLIFQPLWKGEISFCELILANCLVIKGTFLT